MGRPTASLFWSLISPRTVVISFERDVIVAFRPLTAPTPVCAENHVPVHDMIHRQDDHLAVRIEANPPDGDRLQQLAHTSSGKVSSPA